MKAQHKLLGPTNQYFLGPRLNQRRPASSRGLLSAQSLELGPATKNIGLTPYPAKGPKGLYNSLEP